MTATLLGRRHPQRNWGARVREYAVDGMPLIVLENELLRLGFLAGKGADLVEWLLKPVDLDLAWLSPDGIANPALTPASAPHPGASFADVYPGGWQTVFPHGSIPAEVHGAPYGQHGEACLLPWDAWIVEDTPAAVEVAFAVRLRRMPFSLERRVRLEAGAASFTLVETAVNESPVPLRVNWGQHVTFGPPFLEPGCRIVGPAGLAAEQHPPAPGEARRARWQGRGAWPLLPAAEGTGTVDLSLVPEPGSPAEMAYLTGFGADAWIAVENPRTGVTARIAWDGEAQPVCWAWQEFASGLEWPWFGRAFVIGLEPFAGPPPNARLGAHPGEEPLDFAPGESRTIRLAASVVYGA